MVPSIAYIPEQFTILVIDSVVTFQHFSQVTSCTFFQLADRNAPDVVPIAKNKLYVYYGSVGITLRGSFVTERTPVHLNLLIDRPTYGNLVSLIGLMDVSRQPIEVTYVYSPCSQTWGVQCPWYTFALILLEYPKARTKGSQPTR